MCAYMKTRKGHEFEKGKTREGTEWKRIYMLHTYIHILSASDS